MDNSEKTLGEIIREERRRRKMSQDALAQQAGTNQQTIGKIELNKTKHSSFAPVILRVLQLPHTLLTSKKGGAAPRGTRNIPHGSDVVLTGPADLAVYGATQGGQSGALILSVDPVEYVARPHGLLNVKDGYGVIVVEDSMAPEFKPGDIALVHPHIPPRIDNTCVFYAEAPDGTVRAIIKHLRRITDDWWHVCQHNPPGSKDFRLPRSEWQKCHMTVGRYNRF